MTQIQIDLDSKFIARTILKDGRDAPFSKPMETILTQVLSHEASERVTNSIERLNEEIRRRGRV
jgi:uncharacterized ferredoxin-like protein